MNRQKDFKSLAMFVLSMVIFGTIGVFRRYTPLPSAFLAFARGILGGVFLLLSARTAGARASRAVPPRLFAHLALTGAMIGANWMLLFEAFNHTTVGIATLCYYMQPTIVMLLSPVVFHERLNGRKASCACAAVLGMVLVSGVIGEGGPGRGDFSGILLGLGAAALYAGVVIMNKKTPGVDAGLRTTVQLLSAGAVMVPYLLLTGGFAEVTFTFSSVMLLIVMGIVHTGIAYVLYFAGMEGLSVQSIAVLSYIDPVSALLLSALLLKEPLSPLNIMGAVLIIGSAVISETRAAGTKKRP